MKILNHTHKLVTGKAFFTISGEQYKQTRETMVSGNDSVFYVEDMIALGKDIRLWDEFTPNLYTLQCDLATTPGGTNYQHTRCVLETGMIPAMTTVCTIFVKSCVLQKRLL